MSAKRPLVRPTGEIDRMIATVEGSLRNGLTKFDLAGVVDYVEALEREACEVRCHNCSGCKAAGLDPL